MDKEQTKVQQKALEFARSNKKRIAKEITDLGIYPREVNPVSVFMAGSPGAGKTEASKTLLRLLNAESDVVRIDPDDLRAKLPGYNGENAWLFQHATSIITSKCIDLALKNKQNFLLDGTCAIYDKAKSNIERSLNKNRFATIWYVYQEPHMAWTFVKARELIEGRSILAETFIEQYFSAREVVNQIKRELGKELVVHLLQKNVDGTDRLFKANIDQIDNHVPEKYTREDIEIITGLRKL